MSQFLAKILLFGEHTVLLGSKALARPLNVFTARWVFKKEHTDHRLESFWAYLKTVDKLEILLDLDSFGKDIHSGLHLESNIPIGYGLGSSGATVAAVLKKYALDHIVKYSNRELREFMAMMESYFHGQSSGLDPFIIYRESCVVISDDTYNLDAKCLFPSKEYRMFLVDTGIARSTGPLVNAFMEHTHDPRFMTQINSKLIPAIDMAIDGMINANYHKTYNAFKHISHFQYEWLPFLIHESTIDIWRKGMESNYFKIKLCGAGGGGFLLGMTNDWHRFRSTYSDKKILELKE